MQIILSQDQFTLITLLIQLGVIAALSTILVRFDTFKRMLFSEELGWKRKIYLMLLVGGIFAVGVAARLVLNYKAADLTLPAALLVGILAGPTAGAGVGFLVGVVPLFFGEYMAMPLAMACGLFGGLIYLKEPLLEKRMDFSPFTVLKMPSLLKELWKEKQIPVQLIIIASGIVFAILFVEAGMYFEGRYLYSLYSDNPFVVACIILGTLASVGIPLKIWNNTRVELLLYEQQRQLSFARLDALKSKIKPHFLFNTLNTIYSSIRGHPEKARSVVLRLSEVLRTVLDSKGEYCRLSQEIDLVESYLSIEEARFGKGRVTFEKELENGTENLYVPAMILQPIVENSIKHGISKSSQSGKIILKAARKGEYLEILLADNGAGIPQERINAVKSEGIGLSSVDERLRVLFGKRCDFIIESDGKTGTLVNLRFPVMTEVREGL